MGNINILFLLKSSIVSFLLARNMTFVVEEKEKVFECTFNCLSNDRQVYLQNTISIDKEDIKLYISNSFAISENFISKEKLNIISNCINSNFSFNSYIKEDKDYNLFCIKSLLHPNEGEKIDENFWFSQIKAQINHISSICNFVYFQFEKSNFFKETEIQIEDLKNFLVKSINKYLGAISIIKKEFSEGIYSSASIEQIEEEIYNQAVLFSRGDKNANWKIGLLGSRLIELKK